MAGVPVGIRPMALVSGSPKFKAGTKVHVQISQGRTELQLRNGFTTEAFPLSSITEVGSQTEQQISRRITATRIATLGIFALAAKKKKNEATIYLLVSANGSDLVFETDKALKFAQQIRDALPPAAAPASAPVAESQPPSEGIPEQIRSLAELRDADLLTSEEFEAKKAELLARM